MPDDPPILAKLMATIEDRARHRPAGSYTTQLLGGGVDAIGAKLIEEATELVEAAAISDDTARTPGVVHEAADLVYHLLVLLAHAGVTLADVEAELARRFGTSGLEEKRSRT